MMNSSNEDEENYAPGDIHEDVEGAPFRIGQWVQFVKPTDETIDDVGAGCVGKIAYFHYGGSVGEHYPDDPLISVFDLPHDLYWQEELRALTDEEVEKIIEVLVPVEVELVQRAKVKRIWTEKCFTMSD